MSALHDSDEWLFRLFNNRIKCRLLDRFSVWVTHTGSAGFTIGITFAAILTGLSQRRSSYLIAGSRALAALASSHLVSHIVKRLVNRPRPMLRLEHIRTFNVPICAYSFPSGHTTASFAVGVSYALAFPGYSSLWVLWAALVGWSRIYVGVHYPSDVLAGSVVGALFAYISRLVVPGFA
ncbi:MAG: phosphatase PAP2 family protein [Firmicutes bacterium]|nr:phosphatase PAP2 family protein [Bacillota bacterium]